VEGNSYLEFIIPGMVIMVVMQTSYSHISEIIINMKQIGSFNDYLIAPISRVELCIAFLFTSIFIGLFVGLINIGILSFFTSFESINFFQIFYYLILTAIIFSCFGSITGFLSFTWDVQSSISSFIIVPISFLSGTFFSINSLDKNWRFIFEYNPFYYLVSNFRRAFYEIYLINYIIEILIIVFVIVILFISLFIFNRGYKVIN